MKEPTKGTVGRVFIAVSSSYLSFGLLVAVTEHILSSATTKGAEKAPAYFAADVITQCAYLTGAGYLCAAIARSHRFAIVFLTAIGLLVGSFSLVTSWKSEPHWYGFTLLMTYLPCTWLGWALGESRDPHLK